jgi:Right handed beta helix region
LRGLTIDGLGSGLNGIHFDAGGHLAIEDCGIRGFTNAGIAITPGTASSFSVSNTIASNNGRGIAVGASGSAVVTGVLSKVTTNNNNLNGIVVSASVGFPNVAIVDSEASNNGGDGVVVGAAFGQGLAAIMVRNVVASNNKTGLEADGTGATLRVAHSVVTGDGTGVATSGSGTIESYGDNDVDANTNNNTGVLITIPTH